MALTDLTLVFLGSVAVLCNIGLLASIDDMSRAVVGFVGAISWGLFGISAFDVIVTDAGGTTSMAPLAFFGIGLSVVSALFAIYAVLQSLNTEVQETSVDDVL